MRPFLKAIRTTFILGLALLGLSGCAALERARMRPTEMYYAANTTEQFLPKPADFTVPILNRPPPKSRAIGTYQFKTLEGRSFVLKSAVYNARRVGADAIWLRNVQDWAEPFAYDVPQHWESRWETRMERRVTRVKGKDGGPTQVVDELIPVPFQRQTWIPTQHVSGFNHFTSIDAVMLRLE